MADLNQYSSSAIAEYQKGSVTASRIQPFNADGNADRGYYVGNAYFYGNTMYTNSIKPKSGTTVTVDSLAIHPPGFPAATQIDITGKLGAAPTDVPGITGDGDLTGCVLWVSDGTVGANGDLYASRRIALDGAITSACLSPMTRLYSDIEAAGDATIASDGSDTALSVSLSSLPPGTYWMSYSLTYVPTTAFDARDLHFWCAGSVSGVLAGSITGHTQPTGTDCNSTCINWVQTLTSTETITLYGKIASSGSDTVTVQSATYPTVLLAVRIA